MPAIDTADGDHERALPAIVRASADGALQFVALIDGLGSWGCGAEAAARLHDALARVETLPSDIDPAHLINRMCFPFRAVPDDWWTDGWEFSVVGVIVRATTATIVASGAFTVVHQRGDTRSVVYRPETLADRAVREGKMSPADAKGSPAGHVILSRFFMGEARHLTVTRLDTQPGDRLLAGSAPLDAAPTAAHLAARVVRPAAIVRW